MNTAIQALTVLLPIGYLAATLLYGMAFAGTKQPPVARLRRVLLAFVLAVHTLLFALHWVALGTFPVTGTWLIVSSVAWATAVLFALITWRLHQPTVGSLVLGLVFLMQVSASAFGPVQAVARASASPNDGVLTLHAATSTVAAATLILSGVYGFLYLVLFRQMRTRRFGPLFRQLPDLELLTRMTRRAALVGFLMLSLGLNLGIWMAHRYQVPGFDYRDPHVLLIMALCVHFGVIAFSRWIRGVTARRASFAAVAGLVTLIAALLLTLVPSFTFHALG